MTVGKLLHLSGLPNPTSSRKRGMKRFSLHRCCLKTETNSSWYLKNCYYFVKLTLSALRDREKEIEYPGQTTYQPIKWLLDQGTQQLQSLQILEVKMPHGPRETGQEWHNSPSRWQEPAYPPLFFHPSFPRGSAQNRTWYMGLTPPNARQMVVGDEGPSAGLLEFKS